MDEGQGCNTVVSADGWHLAVLIPARNEEEHLPRCLQSLKEARSRLPAGVTSEIIVVSDLSTDETTQIARHILGDGGIVAKSIAGCVGAARALAANLALTRYTGLRSRCWFANTDADCEVPSTWLVDQLEYARNGCSAVAGIVDVHDFSDHSCIVEQRFRASYTIHVDGTHPHVHGANLGIRADAYLLAGGWHDLTTAEDHDLWRRLGSSGALRISDARLRVITSGRRVGRAPLGFADALAAHESAVAA